MSEALEAPAPTGDSAGKLLPCPFCGSDAVLVEGHDGESAYAQCVGAKFHRALWLDGDNNVANDVREAWNRRAGAASSDRQPPQPTGDVVELVKRASEFLSTGREGNNTGPHHIVTDLVAALRLSDSRPPRQSEGGND